MDTYFETMFLESKERMMVYVTNAVNKEYQIMYDNLKKMVLLPADIIDDDGDDNGSPVQAKSLSLSKSTKEKSPNSQSSSPKSIQKSSQVFALKSKSISTPSSSAAQQLPFSGFYKRMAEEDGNGNNSQPNKKKAITVELQNDDPFNDADNQGWADSSADDYVSSVSSFVVDWQGQGGEGSMQGKGKTGQQQDQQKATEQQDQQQATEQQEQQQNYPRTATSASGSEVKSGKSAAVGILSKSPCPTCKVLVTKKNLPRHLKTHTGGKFACPTTGCTKEYTRIENLNLHLLSHQ